MVAAVHRGTRVLRHERPATARAELRAPRPGAWSSSWPRARWPRACRARAPAVQGDDHGAAADDRAVAGGRVAAGQLRRCSARGCWPGEMPAEIEQVFADAGTPLFPGPPRDLEMNCSCPDWEVPCKHLAAVCYVLAEAFDDDPFAMLAWRGKARDEPARRAARQEPGRAGGRAPAGGPARRPAGDQPGSRRCSSDVTGAPLAESLADFWSPGAEPGPAARPAAKPRHAARPAAPDRGPAAASQVRGTEPAGTARPGLRSARGRAAATRPRYGRSARNRGPFWIVHFLPCCSVRCRCLTKHSFDFSAFRRKGIKIRH